CMRTCIRPQHAGTQAYIFRIVLCWNQPPLQDHLVLDNSIPWFDGAIRYNYVPGQNIFSEAFLSGNYNPVTTSIFNKNAFIDPNSPANLATYGTYRLGDLSRNLSSARSFLYSSEDFSIMKQMPITESSDILFKATLIDAFNRHIFDDHDSVDRNPNDPNFGIMNPGATIIGPRRIQLQLKFEF
ncbi:MAG: hypothetical protein ACRD6B_13505, partial [Bryobacteraceae bacterium]